MRKIYWLDKRRGYLLESEVRRRHERASRRAFAVRLKQDASASEGARQCYSSQPVQAKRESQQQRSTCTTHDSYQLADYLHGDLTEVLTSSPALAEDCSWLVDLIQLGPDPIQSGP